MRRTQAQTRPLENRLSKESRASWITPLCWHSLSRFSNENHTNLVIGDLAGVAHEEVRNNQPSRARELAFPAIDPPNGGALLEIGLRRGQEMPAADRAEADQV